MTPRQTVTLQCRSLAVYVTFTLSKEVGMEFLHVTDLNTQARLCLADFKLDIFNIFLGDQYHCYGGYKLTPLWSGPNDSLNMLVAGEGSTQFLMTQ